MQDNHPTQVRITVKRNNGRTTWWADSVTYPASARDIAEDTMAYLNREYGDRFLFTVQDARETLPMAPTTITRIYC